MRSTSVLVALAFLFIPRLVSGQSSLCYRPGPGSRSVRASTYLPLTHWAYPYVALLIARGRLASLDPLGQPYRRIDIARAIRTLEGDSAVTAEEREWLLLIKRELAPEFEDLEGSELVEGRVAGYARAGARGLTQRHRDPLRPTGGEAVFPVAEVEFAAEFPHVAAALRFRWDGWFLNDPQFPDGEVVEHHGSALGFDWAVRSEDGYVTLQIPYFRLLAGRVYRNWGLAGTNGSLVSDYSYSYDQLGYWFGMDCLNVQGLVAQLDEFPNSVKRWYSAHRITWRPNAKLALAAAEAVVYSGVSRSFDFRLSNPVSIWVVGGYGKDYEEGPNSNNSFTEVSAWWRPIRGLVTYLSFMIDDFPGGGTPWQYAGAISLQLPRVSPRMGLRIDYSQVAALTYRSSLQHQVYTFRDIGLGRDVSDSDLFAMQLDWLPAATLMVSPNLQLQRRGEGDIRDPWPVGQAEDLPTLLTGEVETTLRLAVKGQWVPSRWLWLDWDLGENIVQSANHVPGDDRTEFVGRIVVVVTGGAWGRL